MSQNNNVRPSRDGDQFHYLWAARRCLKLLSAECDLVAISIEGPSPDEQESGASSDIGEEVIDIAEYFGSEQISDARLVRYMQLKHSTLHANETWTASGLEKTIRGFAKYYLDLRETFPAGELAAKLEFWFVTNRPISSILMDAVTDAATGGATRHPKELRKLERFVGLKGEELAAFLKLLHFEGRQDNYWEQRNLLFQEVSGYLPDADCDALIQLKELVTRRALSEAESNPVITKIDILRALKTDESLLFPAKCLIEKLSRAVFRSHEANLIKEIVKAKAPVIVHASAGVGKTVFATRIAEGLPDGSISIVYDCFGNGQYRNASGYRHRHKDALVQIANELATKGLCHLLIPTVHADASSYMKAFIHRINQAATQVRLASPNRLLCIVIDAADNAQMAAEENGEARSFVRDLIREELPSNVRLVFLCRTHRQNYLDPPVDSMCRELQHFSQEETADHLRGSFAEANEHDIREFHRLSSCNPRVQALALSRNTTLSETLRLLGPNPTSVDDAIGKLVEGSIARLKDNIGSIERTQIEKICTGLAVLRPLIPIAILSQISGVKEGAIISFATDLGRPLLVDGNKIQFFDEPAETWFREKFKPTNTDMRRFIAGLKPLANVSAYVASVLPQLMLEAGLFSELVELALTSTGLPEISPLEKRDVELQRLQFALKACLRTRRYVEAAKLALKAGGEMAGDDRQQKILQANTDLAAKFLDTGHIQTLVSRRIFGSGWHGSHHAYEAALLSGRSELLGDARSRLRVAYEWLHNWSSLTHDERKSEEISDQDIVELTLADINIHGPEHGARSLEQWTPRDVVFRVGRAIARLLIDHGRFEDLDALAKAAGNNLCLTLGIAEEMREVQRTPPADVTRRALRLVANSRIKLIDDFAWDGQETALNAVTAIVEAGLLLRVCGPVEAAKILSRYLPSEPPQGLSSRFSKARTSLLRAYCLRAALQDQVLELRDLAYPELKSEIDKNNQHSTSHDLQVFQEDIGALLPWHQLRSSILLGRFTKASLEYEIQRTRKASSSAGRVYYRDDFHTSNEIALLWMDVLHRLDAVDAATLKPFITWKSGLKINLCASTLIAFARMCGQKENTKKAALDFALEAFNLIKEEQSDAQIKSEGYIDACRSILLVSHTDAASFFNEAVAVASKIGEENLARWDSILDLADRASCIDYPSPETAYHFARCAELTYEYVRRDKHFNWRATIEALCGLCPASALAILSRWRDRKFGQSERILPIAIGKLLKSGRLDARDVVPLVGYNAQWEYDQLLESALSECTSSDQKNTLILYLVRYMQLAGVDFSKLKKSLSKNGLVIDTVDEIIAFKETVENATQQDEKPLNSCDEAKPALNWETIFSDCNLTSPEEIAGALKVFKGTELPWKSSKFFFKEAIARLQAGSEPLFIKALTSVPDFDLYYFRDFLNEIPDQWRERPSTQSALKDMLKALCRRYCMGITKNRYYEILPFEFACSLSGISECEVVEVVLNAVGEAADLADTSRLFSLVGLLATKLKANEALEVLKFSLDFFTPVLEESHGDGNCSKELLPPSDPKIALAGYIWASMAAPQAALRWEGAHVVFGLAVLGRQDILSHIFKFADEMKGGPFVDARLPFYALHAVQWLLIATARASMEFPAAIAPFGKQIVNLALREQPHVLIRQFAARTALELIHKNLLEDLNGLKNCLTNVNKSTYPIVNSNSYDRLRFNVTSQISIDDRDSFYFGIDIGPYWYQPLGQVFALPQNEVEAEALKIIRNQFGLKISGRWDEDERGKRRLYETYHTLHSHGSYPRVDTLHFYYSYHAMMILAGNLLASTPTHSSMLDGVEDKFADWFILHDLSRGDGRWLWDRRDPAPLERYSWQNRENGNGEDSSLTTEDFDEALKVENFLNVWGEWTQTNSKYVQTIRVYSAFVSRDKSEELLKALSTAECVYDYSIPSADSELEVSELGFPLKGWIVAEGHKRGLDCLDRWSGGINFPPPSPAKYISDLMSLTTDKDYRIWMNPEEAIVMNAQVWGHYMESNRHQADNPEHGCRLRAKLNFVVELLNKLNFDLIIQLQIVRRGSYRPFEVDLIDDQNRIPVTTKIYLLNTDGQFQTF